MSKKEIDIITFVHSLDTSIYAENLKAYADKLKSNNNKINWKFVRSGEELWWPSGFNMIAKTEKTDKRSYSHGLALDEAVKLTTSKYVILCDADIAILYPNWDQVIIDKLDSGLDCFGLEYSKRNNLRKRYYPNIPSVFLFCYNSERLDNSVLIFNPIRSNGNSDATSIVVTDNKTAASLSKNIGDEFCYDTGWRTSLNLLKGYKTEALKCVEIDTEDWMLPIPCQKTLSANKKDSGCMDEWHINDMIFCTHLKDSRKYKFNKGSSQIWLKGINDYFKRFDK